MIKPSFKKNLSALKYILGPKYKKSYSQCAEDLIISHIFKGLGIMNPSYLDIGANDPVVLSNTYLFYKRGCKGTCIEPNPLLAKKIRLKRPHDTVLEVGISSEKGILPYYMFKNHALNTFSIKEADATKNQGHAIIQTKEIVVKTLKETLEEQKITGVDFLSLDVEGLDFEILRSVDFDSFRPKVICVETKSFSPTKALNTKSPIISLLEEKKYRVVSLTPINTIFIDTLVEKA